MQKSEKRRKVLIGDINYYFLKSSIIDIVLRYFD